MRIFNTDKPKMKWSQFTPAAKRFLASKGINSEEDWEKVGPQLCVLCRSIYASGALREPTHYTHQCWLLWCGTAEGVRHHGLAKAEEKFRKLESGINQVNVASAHAGLNDRQLNALRELAGHDTVHEVLCRPSIQDNDLGTALAAYCTTAEYESDGDVLLTEVVERMDRSRQLYDSYVVSLGDY